MMQATIIKQANLLGHIKPPQALCQRILPLNLHGQGGYSMVELIMVIVFIGVAFVATIGMMTGSMQKSAQSETLTQAIFLAEQKMEAIRGDKNSLGYQYLIDENYPVEQEIDGYPGFTRTVTILDFGSYKEIKVTVTHPGFKPVTLITQMTNY